MTIIIMTIERETYCSINYVIKQIKQYLELATDKCTICSIFWVLKIFLFFYYFKVENYDSDSQLFNIRECYLNTLNA